MYWLTFKSRVGTASGMADSVERLEAEELKVDFQWPRLEAVSLAEPIVAAVRMWWSEWVSVVCL